MNKERSTSLRSCLNCWSKQVIKDKAGVLNIDDLKTTFSLFDKDGNGTISIQEIGQVMRSLELDLTDEELNDMINDYDADANGCIDFHEFLDMMGSEMQNASDCEQEVLEAFKIFDKDGNGVLTAAEFQHIMNNLGENVDDEVIDEMMRIADLDGDGLINYKEFFRMVMPSARIVK